ncbi:MAG TPA: UDP-N-acetylmuramoyl-tripeptide--D-alanyl-D-alanine ligase [Candidatus Paceibacterota bacterium]|nr:UDP-N-acetylmuramoyl-tripeptide--D-alanyl-D-alanine ligase [Candidatus Paceibacterota bacterium]
MFLGKYYLLAIYFLQLENYDLRRFVKAFYSRGRSLTAKRQPIIWTRKLKMITVIASVIYFGFILIFLASILRPMTVANVVAKIILGVVLCELLSLICPFVFCLAVFVFWPFDHAIKSRIVGKAKLKLTEAPRLKIIGITGSYGKTTFKEALKTVLEEKYRVLATPENKNTPIGLSRLILDDLGPAFEILIAEMGAYRVGDIKTLCQIAKPDIAVLTGINESHLERFGSIKNTILGKFEIVTNAKLTAPVFLNADNDYILDNYKKFVGEREVNFYSESKFSRTPYAIKNKIYLPDAKGLEFDLTKTEGEDLIGHFKTALIGDYILGTLMGVIEIALKLGLSVAEIQRGFNRLQPIPHRLEPILTAQNVLIIDDSYNGNPAGAREAIKLLKRFSDRRKIYLTPGLVEMGKASEKIHHELGENLAPVADKVILIKNSVSEYIRAGLLNKGFSEDNLTIYPSTDSAHADIKNILKPGDVIIFQNDWTDNYQ